jgi:hypothetical protein
MQAPAQNTWPYLMTEAGLDKKTESPPSTTQEVDSAVHIYLPIMYVAFRLL